MLIGLLKTSTQQTEPPASFVALPSVSFTSYAQTITDENYCISPLNVETQIPFWIKQNYSNDESNNYFISFLTEYYNWLYCGFKKTNINLTPYDIEQLFNIDEVPDSFLDYYVKTYAPFILISSIQNEDRINLRKFLRSIKTDFLISKGTEGSYRYMMKILFNVNNVKIDYPKKYLMRLNGGKYYNFSWDINTNSIIDLPDNFDPKNPIQNDVLVGEVGYNSDTRLNLYGSALNESILPDDNFWQEHSYILTSDASVSDNTILNYKKTVLDGVHPAGTLAFFEQYTSIDTELPANGTTASPPFRLDLGEVPVIGRYLFLYPNYITDPDQNTDYETSFYDVFSNLVCSDPDTLVSYTCYCCVYNCNPTGIGGATAPQHALPFWSSRIRSEIVVPNGTLGHITIEKFLNLTGNSPNLGLNSCLDATRYDCSSCS